MKTKKPFYKRRWFIVIAVLLVLGIIGKIVDNDGVNTTSTTIDKPVEKKINKETTKKDETTAKPKTDLKKEKKEETKPVVTKPKEKTKSFDETTKELVIKTLGKKSNTRKNRLVQEGSSDTDGGKSVVVTLSGDELFTTKSTLRKMETDSAKLFEKLFKNKNVARVNLVWQQTLVDTYGKESDDNVVKIELSRATNDKIEWKNFNVDNFDTVADNFWVHPAMLKK